MLELIVYRPKVSKSYVPVIYVINTNTAWIRHPSMNENSSIIHTLTFKNAKHIWLDIRLLLFHISARISYSRFVVII